MYCRDACATGAGREANPRARAMEADARACAGWSGQRDGAKLRSSKRRLAQKNLIINALFLKSILPLPPL